MEKSIRISLQNNLTLILIVTTITFSGGCTRFSKVTQFTHQKAEGWKLSYDFSHTDCNKVDVIVSAIMVSYESSGINILFFPITTSRDISKKDVSRETPFIAITLRHWYRNELIESCPQSFVELENKATLERVHPVKISNSTFGEHVTRFNTTCIYTFDPKHLSAEKFDVIFNENILGCRLSPIPTVYQKKTINTILEWM